MTDTGLLARIIPAYAGSTARVTEQRALIGDHPRIRGEHRRRPHWLHDRARIIPAYAGSTWGAVAEAVADTDHPRIRGEHPYHIIEVPAEYGSSPHTRGARSGDAPRRQTGRIIPAYAGSTDLHVGL